MKSWIKIAATAAIIAVLGIAVVSTDSQAQTAQIKPIRYVIEITNTYTTRANPSAFVDMSKKGCDPRGTSCTWVRMDSGMRRDQTGTVIVEGTANKEQPAPWFVYYANTPGERGYEAIRVLLTPYSATCSYEAGYPWCQVTGRTVRETATEIIITVKIDFG